MLVDKMIIDNKSASLPGLDTTHQVSAPNLCLRRKLPCWQNSWKHRPKLEDGLTDAGWWQTSAAAAASSLRLTNCVVV